MNIQPGEIKIGCPHCGQHLVLDSSMFGMELECPICRQTFLAAGPDASVAPPPSRKRIMIKHRAPNLASCGGVEMRGSGKGKPKRSRGRAVVVGLVFIIAAVLLARSELFKLISKDGGIIPPGSLMCSIPPSEFESNIKRLGTDGRRIQYGIPWEKQGRVVAFKVRFNEGLNHLWRLDFSTPSETDTIGIVFTDADARCDKRWCFSFNISNDSLEDTHDSLGPVCDPPAPQGVEKWHDVVIRLDEDKTLFCLDGRKTTIPPVGGERRFASIQMTEMGRGAEVKELAVYTTEQHQRSVRLMQAGLDRQDVDFMAGTRMIEEAAENGLSDAQSWLGMMYYGGLVRGKTEKDAYFWLFKAAEQGDPQSQCLVGQMLLTGSGVEKNGAEANKWLLKAAKSGNARAQFLLGGQLFYGMGVNKNVGLAEKWLSTCYDENVSDLFNPRPDRESVGSEGDLGDLCYMLSQIYLRGGSGVERDVDLGRQYLKEAARFGNETAIQVLRNTR